MGISAQLGRLVPAALLAKPFAQEGQTLACLQMRTFSNDDLRLTPSRYSEGPHVNWSSAHLISVARCLQCETRSLRSNSLMA